MRSLFSLITLFDMPLAAIVFLEHSLPIPFEVSFNKMKKKKKEKKTLQLHLMTVLLISVTVELFLNLVNSVTKGFSATLWGSIKSEEWFLSDIYR